METISSNSLVLAFQIFISVLLLVIVGFFYLKAKNKNKQVDLTSKEVDLLTPAPVIPQKDNPSLPPVVPIAKSPEKDPRLINLCPSCGAEMEPGSEFCEACDYGMK